MSIKCSTVLLLITASLVLYTTSGFGKNKSDNKKKPDVKKKSEDNKKPGGKKKPDDKKKPGGKKKDEVINTTIDLTTDKTAPEELPTGYVTIQDAGIKNQYYASVAIYNYGMDGNDAARIRNFGPDEIMDRGKPVEEWAVYVPADYKPSASYGVYVFISASTRNNIPKDWEPMFDKMNLIWISPKQAGNNDHTIYRHAKSACSPSILSRAGYNIDKDRIYIGGGSGGGRMSGRVAISFPHIFSGVFSFNGFDFCKRTPLAGGKFLPPGCNVPPATQAKAFAKLRIAMFYGKKDKLVPYNYAVAVYKNTAQHVRNCKMLTDPNGGHSMPDIDYIKEGMMFVDGACSGHAEKFYKTAVSAMEKATPRKGTALDGFTRAAAYGYDKDFREQAAEERDKLFAEWKEAIAPFEKSLTTLDKDEIAEANKSLPKLQLSWDILGTAYRKNYPVRLKEARAKALKEASKKAEQEK